jgi:hypothetical protein
MKSHLLITQWPQNVYQGGVIDRLNAVNTSPSVHGTCSDIPTCVISGFRLVFENCILLRNYAVITTTRCVITRKSAFLRYAHLFLTTFKRVRYVSDEPCKCFRLQSAFRFSEVTVSWGTRWRSWLRQCATSRRVAASIPDGVTGIFHWQLFWPHYGHGVDPASTEMSARNISWV